MTAEGGAPVVKFSRVWQVVTMLVATIFLLVGTVATGQVIGGFLIAGAFVVGTSNGMAMKAQRVGYSGTGGAD